jgi:hypothetical protein
VLGYAPTMKLPLILVALVLALAGCGGGGGNGDGEAADEGILDTREAEAPPDVRAGAGQPGGVGAEVPQTLVVELSGGAGTVTLDVLDEKTSTVTLDLINGGKTTFNEGTCAKPGKVVHDLGDQIAGFVQLEIPLGVPTLVAKPHAVVVGKSCGEIKASE